MRSAQRWPVASQNYLHRQAGRYRMTNRRITERMMNEKILASLRMELNLQTAQMRWTELARYFAGGTLISVAPELDLVDVGARIAADDKASVQDWMQAERVHRVSDAQAMQWLAEDTLLWTVVVKPWILVQHEPRVPPDAAH